ncbi:MAG: hypothetical protein R3F29_02255 [Planctomycetota bacterium]
MPAANSDAFVRPSTSDRTTRAATSEVITIAATQAGDNAAMSCDDMGHSGDASTVLATTPSRAATA